MLLIDKEALLQAEGPDPILLVSLLSTEHPLLGVPALADKEKTAGDKS